MTGFDGTTPSQKLRAAAAGGTATCFINVLGKLFCTGENDTSGTAGALGSFQHTCPSWMCDTPVESAYFDLSTPSRTGVSLAMFQWAASVVLTKSGSLVLQGSGAPSLLPPFDETLNSKTALALNGGLDHMCAIANDFTVWCFGSNDRGQLGKDPASTPSSWNGFSQVDSSLLNGQPGKRAVAVSAGRQFTCAVTDLGTVLCWGDQKYGTLGDGVVADSFRWQPATILDPDTSGGPKPFEGAAYQLSRSLTAP